jgi:hypothetical protein
MIRIPRFILTILLLGAMVALSACSPTPVRDGLTDAQRAALTPEQQLFVAEADYLINKADFTAYAMQPLCTPGQVTGCHDATVVKEVRALDKQVRAAFLAARTATGADQAAKADIARVLLARFAVRVTALAATGG